LAVAIGVPHTTPTVASGIKKFSIVHVLQLIVQNRSATPFFRNGDTIIGFHIAERVIGAR